MHPMKNRIWSLLMVIGLAFPGTALAQNADMSEAKKHFKSGQAFMQMERWGAAVEEFKKAYEVTKDGLVMGQVALAYEKGQDYEAALAAMKVYRAALGEGERASAEAMIKKYEKLIADGRSKKLVLPGEEAAKAEAARAEAAKKAEATAASEDEGDGKRTHRLYTWIAAGAAGALALSALVVGLNAQSKFDELSDSCSPTCPQSDVDSVKTRALVTDVLWGVAAAAAVTSVVLYFVEGRSLKKEDKLDPGEGTDEEEYVQRRIHIAPMMGGGTYGVGANISF